MEWYLGWRGTKEMLIKVQDFNQMRLINEIHSALWVLPLLQLGLPHNYGETSGTLAPQRQIPRISADSENPLLSRGVTCMLQVQSLCARLTMVFPS